MRLTTKITLGIIGTIFLLSIIAIIYLSSTYDGKKEDKWAYRIEGKQINVDVENYKSVFLELNSDILENNGIFYRMEGSITLSPVTNSNTKNKLYFPEGLKPYLKTSVQDGNLKIALNVDELLKEEENRRIKGIDLLLYSDSSVNITNNIPGLATKLLNMNAEDICIEQYAGSIILENCVFASVSPLIRSNGSFKMLNSKSKVLDIDLDYMRSWNIEKSEIDILNLKSSEQRKATLSKKEIKEVNWYPKTGKARLNIELSSDSAKIIFP